MSSELTERSKVFIICDSQVNYYPTGQINKLYLSVYHTTPGQYYIIYPGVKIPDTNWLTNYLMP